MKHRGAIAIGSVLLGAALLSGSVYAYGVGTDEKPYLSDVLSAYESLSERRITIERNGLSNVVLSMKDHPDWILIDGEKRAMYIDTEKLSAYIQTIFEGTFQEAHAAEVYDEGWVRRASITDVPHIGYDYTVEEVIREVEEALLRGEETVSPSVSFKEANLALTYDEQTYSLTRLSTGLSDFTGSDYGRDANVRKALHDELHGIVLMPGEEFSFNDALRNSYGWRDAYVIVNGGDLEKEPGGGICQAVTTLYRAALLAGLPISNRASHSLYVSHYEEYGVGLDATIYPGKQDFTFVNDTSGPMVIVSRAEGETAIVELYGVDDGRNVEMSGPYFSESKQQDTAFPQLRINQIGWKQTVHFADGTREVGDIISTYRAIPKALHETYGELKGIH